MGHVIDEDFSFAFLDCRSSSSYREAEVDISVKRDAFWSYCGPLLGKEDELPANQHEWASASLSNSLLPLLLPFLAFANEFLTKNGLDHYWLTIRATKATSEFDKPRWHTDDMFFSSGSGGLGAQSAERSGPARPLDLQTDWKLCGTLLGPSTMFVPGEYQPVARDIQRSTKKALATDHSCTSIRCVGCAATADAVRDELGNELSRLGTVQAAPGECSFFRIGPDKGAVHSEPSMNGGDRIFVNVVPGKKAELGNLMAKWGMEFPRAWWIAPNMPQPHLG
ncbi:hypothetical protein DL770_002685 [Monosporascus sp. CRB-9-2]|nr:hypothetical protein DL770_002685 [Monosporascus sp. CRB-9-2]